MKDIIVIGGGPAGMMAATTAAMFGADVVLLEKNKVLGKKLLITGKGRCNVTNHCDEATLLANVAHNPKFLYSAFYGFNVSDTMSFFENLGVPLKTERGNRVFPQSDRSADIQRAMIESLKNSGVQIVCDTAKEVCSDEFVTVLGENSRYEAKRCIIATGGVSYPLTGSTGDGYRFASNLGHSIVTSEPSLVGLRCKGQDPMRLAGLSLRNVELSILSGKDVLYKDFGEMLFTHTGISGPLVLSASAHIERNQNVTAVINLKPALSEAQLDKRLLREFEDNTNKDFLNALSALLPKKLIPVIIERSGLPPHIKVHQITKEGRQDLIRAITEFKLSISGKEDIEGAIITRGGISTNEIVPKTMNSKINKNIYFAGEVIDVDAYTGGFNLQIAFSTGYAAGESAAGGLYNEDD